VLTAIFERWPTPEAMAAADLREVEGLLRPLGLQRSRSRSLIALAVRYADGCHVADLPGVGRYALDAWAIFVEGRTDVEPEDGYLNLYVAWRIASGTWAPDR
jgi:adenine-specific DNA glycosylase